MVKSIQDIDLDRMRFYVSMGTLVTVLWAVWYFASWKTEVDIIMKQDKVSTTDFAVLKTDVSYIKSELWTIRALLEKKG